MKSLTLVTTPFAALTFR